MADARDLYSRVDYRRFVGWPQRIRREAPFLLRVLETAPRPSVLDLGCGSGEHCRFLARKGFEVVGVDASPSMIEKATEKPPPAGVTFVQGNIENIGSLVRRRFGAALSVGNTLVHLREEDQLRRCFQGVSDRLVDHGIFLFQILNYERIFDQGIRNLPLNFRPTKKGEIVFLRLMELLEEGRVRFCPSTLEYRPGEDQPLRLVRSKLVELRGWKRPELERLLERAGLEVSACYGDMSESPYQEDSSPDLVVVATRRSRKVESHRQMRS